MARVHTARRTFHRQRCCEHEKTYRQRISCSCIHSTSVDGRRGVCSWRFQGHTHSSSVGGSKDSDAAVTPLHTTTHLPHPQSCSRLSVCCIHDAATTQQHPETGRQICFDQAGVTDRAGGCFFHKRQGNTDMLALQWLYRRRAGLCAIQSTGLVSRRVVEWLSQPCIRH